MVKFNAKNCEVYLATVNTIADFTPGSKGNNTTLAAYLDAAITAGDVSALTKVSSELTEVSIEPAENDSETRKFFGSTSDGAQNSEVITTINADLNVTLSGDAEFAENISKFAIELSSDTHATVDNYQSFNLGTLNEDDILLYIRVKKLVSGTYYFKNYVILQPTFTQLGEASGSADDAALAVEHSLLGTKSKAWKDNYSDTTDETLSNI